MKRYAFYPLLIVLLELQKYTAMNLTVLGFFAILCVCVDYDLVFCLYAILKTP